MKLISVWLFILAVAMMPCLVTAQQIKLVSSTVQRWSGGVAGRHGSHYFFTIRCSGTKVEMRPDTLWIENEYIPLFLAPAQGANTKRTTIHNATTFEITVSTAHDDYAERSPGSAPGSSYLQAPAPISYKGVALLSYRYRGVRRFYTIAGILKENPPIAYP